MTRDSPPVGRGLRELKELDLVLRALAHASRRHILVVLLARGSRMGAGDIAKRFSCAWPTTSRHLRVLEGAGLVRVERQGREWIYVLEAERLRGVVGGWLRHFEPLKPRKEEI
jgi:DNA-binding transcriptional ArsR family regulator